MEFIKAGPIFLRVILCLFLFSIEGMGQSPSLQASSSQTPPSHATPSQDSTLPGPSLKIQFPFAGDSLSLSGKAEYAFSTTGIKGFPVSGREKFQVLDSASVNGKSFTERQAFSKRSIFPDSIQGVWVRFTINNTIKNAGNNTGKNAGKNDSIVILNSVKRVPLFYLYKLEKGRLVEIGRSGYEMPYSRQSMRGDDKRIPFFIAGSKNQTESSDQTFYLYFQRYHDEMIVSVPALFKKEIALMEYQDEENRRLAGKTIQFFLAGFFLAISVYSLLKFFSQSHDKVYFLYALVNASCCLGITVYYNLPDFESSLFPWLKNNKEICAILSDLTIVLNFLFLTAVMDLKSESRTLYKLTWAYILFHLVATILIPVMASNPGNIKLSRISFYLYPVCESLCLGLYILYVLHLWERREGFLKYLFYGCCVMTFGMFLFTLSAIFLTQAPFISKEGTVTEYIIMAFFIFSEVWFFIMALTQREKQTELDNAKYQQELIAQLSAGKLQQENFTKDLERQVAERSEQILQHQQLLEQERRDRLLAVLKRRISETELKALRSQMNPHFIFNSLNSIENFMMKNDKRMASSYFHKFASLIRMILDSSRNELVSFAKDMEALQLYVELEQLRYGHKFQYKAIMDPRLLDGDYPVPPLLIQPYVENAILHGLAQSDKEELALVVEAGFDDDYLIYTIQDNGIGREKAATYKPQRLPYKSMGMQITRERISILNQQQQANGEIEITDLYDEDRQPCGTKVRVRLKAF